MPSFIEILALIMELSRHAT